jgi:hypothetical protein
MNLEGIGITQSQRHGPFQIRLKFGKQAYCVVRIRESDDAKESAKRCVVITDAGAEGSGSKNCSGLSPRASVTFRRSATSRLA